MIALLFSLLAAPTFAAPDAVERVEDAPPAETVTVDLVVQVAQPSEAADALVAEARKAGGWFQSRTSTEVSLRVPTDRAEALLAYAATLGKVADRSVQRSDLARDLAELRGRMEAREQVLERYYTVLDSAGPGSVVSVERQIVDAIEQLEALKGRIRLLEDQAEWARVNVSFRYRDRRAPARSSASSFGWLNTLNVQDVVAGFQAYRADWKTKGVGIAAPPQGFSAWRKASRYRAASPEGVLYRVRTVKHAPRADLSFWKEAVRERMIAAGYKVVGEQALEAHGTTGALIELAAPIGEADWSYLVGFFPVGGRIVIAEAAGEVGELDQRRGALLEAMGANSP